MHSCLLFPALHQAQRAERPDPRACPDGRTPFAEGQPPTLLGRPVVEAIDLPDVAANSTPIVYGDLSAAYRIFDRVGFSVLRDPYTLSDYGQTKFTARRRVAGAVVRPEALRKLRVSVN